MNNSLLLLKKLNKAIIVVLVLVITASFFLRASALDNRTAAVYENTANLLSYKNADGVNSVGGEWKVMGLAQCDYRVPYSFFEEYLENVTEEISQKSGVLSKNKYSEYSRVILALSSINADVANIAGYNLLTYLSDFNKVKKQGVNGPIWALIALDCKNYTIPKVTEGEMQTSRQMLIDYILQKELADGGWNLLGNSADTDITAMAITALSKYYNSNKEVKSAVDRGLKVLSSLQEDSGKYSSWGTENAESIAQVIVALTSLGINPYTDSRFIKKGNTTVDALLDFAFEKGGFSHTENGEYNQMATEQSFYALVALDRFSKGKNSLFNMTEEKSKDTSVDNGSYFDSKEDDHKNNSSNSHSNNTITNNQNGNYNKNNSGKNTAGNNSVANNNFTKEIKNKAENPVKSEENINLNDSNTNSKTGERKLPQKNSGESISNGTGNGEDSTAFEASTQDTIKKNRAIKQEEKRSRIIYIVLGALLLALIAFVVVRIIKRKKSKNRNNAGE